MSAARRTGLVVDEGWLAGNAIRLARKTYLCEYFRGSGNGGHCRAPINPGDHYVEGEYTGKEGHNGVLVRDKYCLACAGPEASASLAAECAS